MPMAVAHAQDTVSDVARIEGDILPDLASKRTGSQSRTAASTSATPLWNYKDPQDSKAVLVPYVIKAGLPAATKASLDAAIADFNKFTCVRLIPRTQQPTYLSFFDGRPGDCHSYIGMQGIADQQVSLGRGCGQKGVVIHELIHSLGGFHEINRMDRDKFVTIHTDKIPKASLPNFAKNADFDTQGLPYDYASLMHYPGTAFSKDGSRTFTPKDPKALSVIGQRDGFSKLDIQKINKLYKCPASPTP